MPVPLLEIIYKDDHLVAINKPHGLLVHRSPIATDVDVFAVQLLRNQLGARVWPAHRLDRKTAGVLLFALDPEPNTALHQLFAQRKVKKTYRAIVRGYTDDEGIINRELKNHESGEFQSALTTYRTLARAEIPLPHGPHQTSRYSLVELEPHTGRQHQLRRHLAGIDHPIIGDRPHGCNKQNRLWKNTFNFTHMLLHAAELRLPHPVSGEELIIRAEEQEMFRRGREVLGLV
ncbi:MAG: pseudouridylate synthase [Bacteroidetes bacterium]|nr:MAG: pseudouridylate synthase [Bacteroidota bacterium]